MKEHSRGVYSLVSYWVVGAIPLLCLRTVHFVLYAVISHKLMGLEGGGNSFIFEAILSRNFPFFADRESFYYLNMFGFQMASSVLCYFFVIQATEVRSIYYAIPGTAFLLFLFSGMLVKPSTLPRWCAPWMPSISAIRWFMQGGMISEGEDNPSLFREIPGDFDLYKSYMSMFGWNGKTKEYCFDVLLINIAVYFGLCLFALIKTTRGQSGRRQLRMPEDDSRLF